MIQNSKKRRIESPLRYPGGKSRAISIILQYLPSTVRAICSPFIGGGSIELSCVRRGIRVIGYDVFKPLIGFWQCILEDPNRLVDKILTLIPTNRDRFYEMRGAYPSLVDEYDKASYFYIFNKSSFSGLTFSGGFSDTSSRRNLVRKKVERLRWFSAKGLSVSYGDYKDTIRKHSDMFLYLDPPYLLKNSMLYGYSGSTHKGFDHESLRDIIYDHKSGFILSYNDCEEVREWYKDFSIIKIEWKYGMSKDKGSKEVLVMPYEVGQRYKKQGLLF